MRPSMKLFPRYLLIPPIFLATAACLWLVFTVLPYSILHICVSGRRSGLQCFPSESSGFSLHVYDLSTRISEVVVKPQPLRLESSQVQANPTKQGESLVRSIPQQEDQIGLADAALQTFKPVGESLEPPHDNGALESIKEHMSDGIDTISATDESGRESQEPLGFPSATEQGLQGEGPKKGQKESASALEGRHNIVAPLANNNGNQQPEEVKAAIAVGSNSTNLPGNSADHVARVAEIGLNSTKNLEWSLSDAANVSTQQEQANLGNSTDFKGSNNTGNVNTQQEHAKGVVDQVGGKATSARVKSSADRHVEWLMEGMRRSATPPKGSRRLTKGKNSSCDGRRVYIYDLPSKFNTDLLRGCAEAFPWFNMCRFLTNSGMGELTSTSRTLHMGLSEVLVPADTWYTTHQYALEMLFHARLKEYVCLTLDPEVATLFYVPFYAGLDVLRWHFRPNATNEQRDNLSIALLDWLDAHSPWWKRRGARDHLLVLGKISWDFRRGVNMTWGSQLLSLPPTQGATKLLIERHPWHDNDIGIPHPTFFHPSSDDDIRLWQQHIASMPRRHLISFAGKPRHQQSKSIRGALIEQCLNRSDACFFLDCEADICLQPAIVMSLFMGSEFCLQPPGDSPTRRSIFDSLIAGCVPVLFDPYSAYYQYPWHLPLDPTSYSVYVPEEDVHGKKGSTSVVNIVEVLERIPSSVRAEMRRTIIHDIMPGLLYAAPGAQLMEFDDAFDIALNSMLWRTTNMIHDFAVTSSMV